MEVLGAVASCTAVITLALQSIKIIYEVTKSVSTGSDDINKLARSTSNLRKLLEAIQRLAERAESTNSVADGKLLEKLTPVVKQCADELAKIPPRLDRLLKGTDDPVWKKAKKYARVFLDTKGVAEIWNTVNHYVELLGTYLGNAGVDVGLYNAERLYSLHNELSEGFRDTKLRYARIEDILNDQRAQAQELSNDLLAELHQQALEAGGAAAAHYEGLAGLKTSICDVRSSLISHCDQAKSRSKELLTEMRQQFLNAGNVASSGIEGIAHLEAHVNDLGTVTLDHIHQSSLRSEKILTEARSSAITQIQEVERSRKEVMQKLNGLSDHLEVIPSMTREQSSILQDLVEVMSHIQLEIGAIRQGLPKSAKSEDSQAENGRNISHMTYDADIERSVARLCDLACTKTPRKTSRKAQSVIEDMRKILDLIMEQIGPATPNRDELPKKRKRLSDDHYSQMKMAVDLKENLARAQHILKASQRFLIHSQDLGETYETFPSRRLRTLLPRFSQKSIMENGPRRKVEDTSLESTPASWTLPYGRLDATFKTCLLTDSLNDTLNNPDHDMDSAEETFAAKVVVTPASVTRSKFQITIDLAEKMYENRTVQFTPTITFRAIIPDDSEVFRVAKYGSVKKLEKFLNGGHASLGDCDTRGRSLLNFALSNSRPKMTKFLIQSGADVDTLEPVDLPGSKWLVKPPQMFYALYVDLNPQALGSLSECFKLLLDAGSDTSSVAWIDKGAGYWASSFSLTLVFGTLGRLKMLMNQGEPLISLESTGDKNPVETIPLLLLAETNVIGRYSACQIPEKVALLLSRGANVNARNSRVDEKGNSVSDNAINFGHQETWTKALKYCGIDIKDVLSRPSVNSAYSTSLDPRYSETSRALTSRISLAEYLDRRKAFYDSNCDYGAPFSYSSDDTESEDQTDEEYEARKEEGGNVMEDDGLVYDECDSTPTKKKVKLE